MSNRVENQPGFSGRKISRRGFLKGAGAVVVAGGLAALGVDCAPSEEHTTNPTQNSNLTQEGHAPGLSRDNDSIVTSTEISTATNTPEATSTPEKEPVTLREWADKAHLNIGATLSHLEVPGMEVLLARDFNTASISYDLAWNNLEETQGALEFTNREKFANSESRVDFANLNGMKINAQSLIFAQEYPDWVKGSPFTKEQATALVQGHIRDVMTHFKGKISEWVVVNEFHPLSWGQPDVLQQVLGDDLLTIAFQAARDADPDAKLIYNDNANHSQHGGNALDTGAYQNTKSIVDRLKEKGLIDGVGVEMHLDGSSIPSTDDITATLKSYDLPVYITEMDINMKNVPGTQEDRFTKQAEEYKNVLEAALATGKCKDITFYTVGDKYSWIETDKSYVQYSPEADPTPFDDNLQPKPAFQAIFDVVKSQA